MTCGHETELVILIRYNTIKASYLACYGRTDLSFSALFPAGIINFTNRLMLNTEWDVVHVQQQQAAKWQAVKAMAGVVPAVAIE
jgi:hypothetical protein